MGDRVHCFFICCIGYHASIYRRDIVRYLVYRQNGKGRLKLLSLLLNCGGYFGLIAMKVLRVKDRGGRGSVKESEKL